MERWKNDIGLSQWEVPLSAEAIPDIDLYMDQILTLTEDKGVTKTMINNYSKERLIKPLKGKKYNKEQIIQILCIMNLKQTLSMNHIKGLMPQEEGLVDFTKVYAAWAAENDRLADAASEFVKTQINAEGGLTAEEEALTAAMMLSSCCTYFRKLCEKMAEEKWGSE